MQRRVKMHVTNTMIIYDKDDRTLIASVPLTKDAVHEEELMTSNFVKLSWYDKKRMTLPVGAYVVPFSDGLKYRLFEPYTPTAEKHAKFKYEPEFQHPVMWLGKIPFIHLEGDTSSWDTAIKRYDWTFTGPPNEIAERVVRYINWLSSVMPSFCAVFGRGWTMRVEGDLPPNATCSFTTLDIMSAAAEIASKFECEYHFDYDSKVFHLGKIAYNKRGGEPYVLKSGANVGVYSVSASKESYANCFIVNGGTRNLSKEDSEGGYVQVNQRLTLDETMFPDSIIDIREDDNEPIIVRELVFDNIYPKLELYVYNPRERVCWLRDSSGNLVPDENGRLHPDGNKYKVYSKWYVRLAYLSDGEWKDYALTEDRMIKDKKPMLSFEVNPESVMYDSSLAGKEFEVVYFEYDREESDDNVDGTFTAHAGDYRIEFIEQNGVIIPTSSTDGVCPKGGSEPSKENNKASMYNVVVDDTYKEVAREELYNEAMRTINRLKTNLNTYTFPSNPIYFKDSNPNLYIGQSVVFNDGQDLNGGTSYTLSTHVRKLVTRIDKPYITTITVGNEKRKGNVSSMKDQIQTIISGGYGYGNGSGVGGTSLTEEQFEQLVGNYGTEFFLSKINDDEAKGLIGFLKGAYFGAKEWMIDNLGNANLNNVTANGVLRALRAYINNVQSTNYSGDGMLDTGWRITNEYEGGNSKATFDYLYIRKKAIFEELELRKISHIGGNFALSPASGRAWKVEYFDGDGKQLGVDEFTVPYTLGGRLLALFSHNLANRFLSRKKKVSRELTSEEKLRTKRVRVLMFSDDGTTRTMQNWTVGAQARCQTFNITQQMDYHGSGTDSNNPDVEFWTGRKVQNTYWWRLVSAVGEATCEDNKVHSYVEFLVNQPNASTYEDVGSDLPAVGDEFCQFGHRTNPTQGNVIMIETANDDSPAMKFYHHVNSWNLNGKRCINISPELFEAKASIFKWITEYGTESQVINRGLWVDIDVDGDGKRRCYYNDIAAHNGVVWRCIIADGTHKEDDNGHWYTQEELDHMTQEQIAALIDVRNYTTQEPSDTAGDWEKYVYASIAPFLKLSDAMVAVPCENDGKATSAVSKTITVKLMVTNLEATITKVTLEGGDSYVTKSGNNILVSIPANTVVTNKNYTVTAEGTCNGQKYVASDQISVYAVMKGDAAYEVTANPNHWIWWQEGANYSYEDIMRMIEEGTYPSDLPIKIDGRPADNSLGNSGTQISVTVDGVAQTFRIERVTASVNGVTTSYDNTLGRVWVTAVPTNVEGGYIDISVRYGNNALTTLRVQFSCNLLGTWRELTFGDVNAAIATKTFDILDENGNVVSHKTIAQYFRSSSQDSASLSHTVNTQGSSISNLNTRVSTAEGNITTISSEVTTIDGKFSSYYTKTETSELVNQRISTATSGMVTTSNFQQTAQSFSLCTTTTAQGYANTAERNAKGAAQGYADDAEAAAKSYANGKDTALRSDLRTTGIVIDGEDSHIDLIGDKVNFYDSEGNQSNIVFDTDDNIYRIGNFSIAGDHIFGNEFNSDGSYKDRGIEMYTNGTCVLKSTSGGGLTLKTMGNVQQWGWNGHGWEPVFEIDGKNVNVMLQATKFNVNTNAEVTGKLKVDGVVSLKGSLVVGSTLTLPYTPEDGEMYLCKGLVNDLTVYTSRHPIIKSDTKEVQTRANSSVDFGDDAIILVFSEANGKWIRFDCW